MQRYIYSDSPAIARAYANKSPDQYCRQHLEYWLEENGKSIQSYYDWLNHRLAVDRPLNARDYPADSDQSWLDIFA